VSLIAQFLETAVLHLQNGFVLPAFDGNEAPSVFQNSFHRDFPRVLNGYLASVNILFAVDEVYRKEWSHAGRAGHTSIAFRTESGLSQGCGSPSRVSGGRNGHFDSTLWHAAGGNTSGKDRLALIISSRARISNNKSITFALWATSGSIAQSSERSNC